eukprot:4148898-Amphidinium_carterae.1
MSRKLVPHTSRPGPKVLRFDLSLGVEICGEQTESAIKTVKQRQLHYACDYVTQGSEKKDVPKRGREKDNPPQRQ